MTCFFAQNTSWDPPQSGDLQGGGGMQNRYRHMGFSENIVPPRFDTCSLSRYVYIYINVCVYRYEIYIFSPC